jgi:signal transduction protein with GAF and PtsI domain
MRLKEAIRISDTRKDSRYRADEMVRLSELCVPIMLNGELIGIIDSEHPEVNWYNETHVYILNTLASMIATKWKPFGATGTGETTLEFVSDETRESRRRTRHLAQSNESAFYF